MTYYNRIIDSYLLEWKEDLHRRPLVVRGARQVGKSWAIRNLGKHFKYFIEINLERDYSIAQLFDGDLDVRKICDTISLLTNTPVIPGETLLFIDEIQGSERAIASLRYFYEDYQELHVVAAGSLLEFALGELPSFGVGRIQSLYMYPFSFDEYLNAIGQAGLCRLKNQASPETPLPKAIASTLVSYLRQFYVIGGMPAAVGIWVETADIKKVHRIHTEIITSYEDDFAKYRTRIKPLTLRNTLLAVAGQAGCKFVYSRVEGTEKNETVKEALQLLSLAGLISPVIHTSANGIPLGAETNPKFIKYNFMDIGLMQTLLGTEPRTTILDNENDFVNKGGMSEVFAGLELTKYASPYTPHSLFYWQRLKGGSQAEVDYVISIDHRIIPLEIKSNTSGSMQSMRLFIDLKECPYGIRSSLENFSAYSDIRVIPLYALRVLADLINR